MTIDGFLKSAGVVCIAIGLFGVLWPMPLFTLNEPYVTSYVNAIYRLTGADYSCGTALVYLWLLFTMPGGFILTGVGIGLFSWRQK